MTYDVIMSCEFICDDNMCDFESSLAGNGSRGEEEWERAHVATQKGGGVT